MSKLALNLFCDETLHVPTPVPKISIHVHVKSHPIFFCISNSLLIQAVSAWQTRTNILSFETLYLQISFQYRTSTSTTYFVHYYYGNQGDEWKMGQFSVMGNGYELIFYGVLGAGEESDIAIDSVSHRIGSCGEIFLSLWVSLIRSQAALFLQCIFQTGCEIYFALLLLQWNLVITRSLGSLKLPCYIRFLIISG